jgi:glutathione S-transferase
MPLVHLVLGLALLEFFLFGYAVARARGRYRIAAPAIQGHEMFERYVRVQMNTLEQLVLFVPSLLVFAHYFNPNVAAALGVLFIIGRALYFQGYVKSPEKRSLGFIFGAVPTAILLFGAIIGAARAFLLR